MSASPSITQQFFLSARGRRPGVVVALAVGFLVLDLAMLAFPDRIARFSPVEADPSAILRPPSDVHLFGTDVNGMDVFSRVVWGARIDLTIVLIATTIAVTVGTALGAWAGYYAERPGWRGLLSDVMLRAADAFQAFPAIVIALALAAVLGRNIFNVIYVLAFVQVPFFLRLTRSSVLSIRQERFVDAARCAGNLELRLVLRHILPNALTPSLVNASVAAGSAMLLTAGLSFVGVGVPAPTPEWGYMIAVGASNLYTGQWWPALFPGAAIGLTVVSLATLGEVLRRALDPGER